jgi:hypothetical protein
MDTSCFVVRNEFAPRIDARQERNRLNYCTSRYIDVTDPLNNSLKRCAKISRAAQVETGGMRVTIDAASTGQLVFERNSRGACPLHEVAFNFLAPGMRANDAMGRMAI